MLCVKCQKRPAVVFVQRLENGKTVQEGYCLTCARAMHIQPVDDLMKQFGMSDQDLENMEERMSSFLQEASDSGMLAPMMNGDDTDAGDEPAPQDDFVPGGSPVFPFGFGARQNKDDAKPKNGKKEKAPRRKFLETYCENLTQKARDGKTDRIIGRDREIYRTIQILCRRQKNNPCLIGEAGVGKTAIAEGIAQRIAEGKVPARLQDKEIYLLDMTSLVAGTQFRGQFEQRVKGLISEVKAAGNIILFIDEIHSIVGAGDSDGSMNAANIMKPALSRGQMQVIGATTFAEYRKYIEKDSALERRFQPVKVEEPSLLDTIEVIKGIRVYYEKHHCVRVSDPIVTSIVKLSERYITDRFLPDKAIDLLDESCACCNLRHPEITELMETQRTVADLETREHELENPEPQNGQDAAIDYEALAAAVEGGVVKDDAYYEDMAMKKGISVQLAKEMDALESENAKHRAAEQQRAEAAKMEAIQQEWDAAVERIRAEDPDFDIKTALADPDFAQMLKLGVKMEDAYKARYFDDIMARKTAETAKKTESGVVERIRQRGARPSENGTNPVGAAVLKTDVSKLTPAQCEELERRAMRGQIITF